LKQSVFNKTNSGTIPKRFGFVQNDIGTFVLSFLTLLPEPGSSYPAPFHYPVRFLSNSAQA